MHAFMYNPNKRFMLKMGLQSHVVGLCCIIVTAPISYRWE
jgi:hypothetical protein